MTSSSSPHEEEQEMEAEALSAIYESSFQIHSPKCWSILLRPMDTGVPFDHDNACDEDDQQNHVAVKLSVTLTPLYPILEIPLLEIKTLKGLTQEHERILLQLAQQEANNNLGMPVVFTICEAIKSWLLDHNQKGLDDTSMHAQMMRKMMEAQKTMDQPPKQVYESHKAKMELSSTELEEITLRKRREDGTPCTDETFHKWKKTFDAEMALLYSNPSLEEKNKEYESRPSGYEIFSSKLGLLNLDALEQAADAILQQENYDFKGVDAQLFEEEDLDDLDFEDEEEDDDDDDDDDYDEDDMDGDDVDI